MGYFATALAMDIVSERKKSIAVGVFNSFVFIGIFLSGIIGGILWENLGALTSFRIAFFAFIVAALPINFLVKGIRQNLRKT